MADEKPIAELGGKSWSELEITQHENGRLMFPSVVRQREPSGAVKETKVRVCVPQPHDNIHAKVEARIWFGSLKALDPDRDRLLFDEMEQLCLLARSIRTFDAPHPQFCAHDELARYDEGCLHDIQERINGFKAALDPREADIDEKRFWELVQAVGRSRSIGPLLDIAGRAQPSCIVRMAKEALLSPTGRSFAASSETSTPAH